MKKNRSRFLLLALLAGAIALFVIFDVKQYLSLDYLKSQQEAFKAYYSAHHFLTLFLFFMLYVVVTTFSLPGAVILTMASGVLFGLGMGLAYQTIKLHRGEFNLQSTEGKGTHIEIRLPVRKINSN
jgi:uncharacterized membrane protein YdjX (TVP38/TMEM64 family)